MRYKLIPIFLFPLYLTLCLPFCEGDLVFLSVQGQITVSQGDHNVKAALYISDVTGLNVISAELRVGYDPDVVEAVGIDLAGTIAEGSSSAYNVKDGSISIALTRATPYSGSGVFAYVLFDAVTQGQGVISKLEIVKAKLNEGKDHDVEVGRSDTQTPPVGPSAVTFKGMRLKMDFISNSASHEIRVTLVNKRPVGEQPTGVASVLNRYWVIDRGGEGEFEVNLTFTLGPGMIGPGDQDNPSNLKLFRREGNSTGNWTLIASATSANAATGEVRFEGIRSFSQFTIGTTGDSSLPAEPLILTGFPSRDGVLLRWEAESEVSNVGFVVYRRDEGGGYRRIKFIPSAGNTAFPTSYTFIDRDVSPGGTYYYYVESVDISGMRRESRVIRVRVPVGSNRFALLQSYPNPFNSEVWIPYELGGEVPVVIEIYDGVGHLVRKLDLGLQPRGRYVSKLRSGYWDGRDMDGNRVASGVYYYVLRAGSFMAIGKMTIIK